MYGLTRGVLTLLGAAGAGVLIWLGSRIAGGNPSTREFWTFAGLLAAAGLVMALSQLLGGWTKWGWPRVSGNVFLLGFLPVLIVAGWVVATGEPGSQWLGNHVRSWSGNIGVDGLVADLRHAWPALAFGIGLVFGLTFDTTGPRTKEVAPVEPARRAEGGRGDDERRVRISAGDGTAAPQAEPAPRSGEPAAKK